MKKYILLAVTLLTSMTMWAQTYVKHEGVTYKITNSTSNYVSVYQDSSSVNKLSGTVSIPGTFTEETVVYTVTGFDRWTYGNEVSLDLSQCTQLTSINLENIHTNIATLKLPKEMVTVDPYTSSYSYGQRAIVAFDVVAGGNFSVAGGVLFNSDKTKLVCYPQRKDGVLYTVPSTVTEISYGAFCYNTVLQKVVLPTNLSIIGGYAFYNCSNLTDVNIPSSLKQIGTYAFANCKLNFADATFVLPSSLTSIGSYAFYNSFVDYGNVTVVFPSNMGISDKAINVGDRAFQCGIVRAEMTDPAVSHNNAFLYVSTIYVPKGLKSTYTIVTGWGYNNSTIYDKIKESASSAVDPTKETVAKPTITETISGSSLNLSFATTTEAATIRYKIYSGVDNSDPVDWDIYDNEAKSISSGQSVKVIALKTGMNDSEIAQKTYDFSEMKCKQPTINFNQTDTVISITTATADAVIYYTADGSDPSTTNGIKYDKPIVPIANDVTYKAIAVKDNMFNSPISDELYIGSFFKCPAVLFKQIQEDGSSKMELKLADSDKVNTSGMDIYYQINNYHYSDESWRNYGSLYTGPVPVEDGNTIYAVAIKTGYNRSDLTSKRMVYADSSWVACASPSIYIDSEKKLISIAAPDTLDVYYVIEPVGQSMTPSTSSTKYDGKPFSSDVNGTVKAICAKAGYINSPVSSYSLDEWFRLADVIFEPAFEENDGVVNYSVSFSHEVEDVDIRYYVSNSYYYDDSAAKLLYDGTPVPVTLGQYVFAKASKTGQVDSQWRNFYVSTSNLKVARPSVNYSDSETKKMVVTTTTPNASVYYYTVDDNENILTTATKMTKDTLELKRNDNLRFYAVKDKMATSDTLSYSVTSWFRVPDVTFEPYADGDSLKMRLTCSDPDAIIYYDFDDFNSSNLPANVLYKEPFTVANNKYVYASAAKDGFNNASTRNTYIRYSSYTCSSPTISISSADIGVTISADEGAEIYYTLDGSDPTINSTKYTSKFTLTENCTVRAIAVATGKLNSSISEKSYSGFRVDEVSITPFVEDNKLKIKLETTTPGAKIYYALNETNSEVTENLPYTAPFEVPDGTYVYANAKKDGYNYAGWSSFGWIYLSNYTCNQPTITIKADTTVVMSANEGATIYYTLDGTDPTTSSTKYTSEFKLKHNVDIRAIAIEAGKINSSVRQRTYNSFYVGYPEFSLDGTKMTITSATPDVNIFYAYEVDPRDETTGSIVYSRKYTAPFDLEYNGYLYVRVEKDDFQSRTGDYWVNSIVRWQKPEVLSNNGHALKFKEIEGATIWYTTNGDYPGSGYYNSIEYKDSILLTGTGTIRAMAQGNYRNDSEVAEISINSYAGLNGATSEKAGGLATSMGWANPSAITEFTVTGPINADDMSFIKTKMTSLQHLDLSEATVDDGKIPDKAFADMPLLEFSSPNGLQAVGDNIFSGCDNLAAVVWNTTAKIPDNAFDADVNPNLLLFVPSEDAAPTNSYAQNIIVNGTAKNIILSDGEGNNFHCPQGFHAQNITYTHNFQLESGEGYGWETIALPFECSRFVHESKGELLPFAAYDSLTEKAQYKPFWLRELTDIEFKDVSKIEPNKPYIICMPNSDSYATRYRVGGKVTFSATDTWVPVTEPQSVQKGVNTLYANFLNSENTDDIMLLNTEETDGKKAGSIFKKRSGRALRPFEAYVISRANARDYVSVTRGFSDDPDADDDTTPIETISTQSSGKMVKVYSLSGVLVKEAAEEDALKGLAKGVYIVNGKSMIVK